MSEIDDHKRNPAVKISLANAIQRGGVICCKIYITVDKFAKMWTRSNLEVNEVTFSNHGLHPNRPQYHASRFRTGRIICSESSVRAELWEHFVIY